MPPAPPARMPDRLRPRPGGRKLRALGTWTRGTSNRSPAWIVTAAIAAALVAMPVAAILVLALTPSEYIWGHLAASVLPDALRNTFLLCGGAGLLSLVTGTAAAWLVTMYHFPGRALADRLLVLPLAMPVYIVAYAYVDLLDFAGPVQTAIRTLGDGWRQTRLGDIRSLPGAILIFASVLYPYVYLSARASFVQQSVCVLEVARTLGQTALGTFRAVALPMARPALAAGVTLVVMECLNDLGAVQYLGVETLSASIYATWLQRSNLAGAAQLASVMLIIIAALMIWESRAEGRAQYQNTTGRQRAIAFETLEGWHGYAALSLVLIPVVIGFAVPFVVLCLHAVRHFGDQLSPSFLRAARNSLILALLASLIAVILSLFFGYAARIAKSPLTTASARIAGLGYAMPGTVLGLGLLVPLAAFDNTLDGWLRAWTGYGPGLMFSGSLVAVTLALVIRFLAVAQGSIDAGLGRISINLDAAASTLGASALSALFRVHLPLLAPALGAAALMVFVDAMKELPATLLLRPFNFETLATHIYGLAAAEQFEEAALGAVTIVLTGLLPVLLLHKTIARSYTGSD